MVLSIGENTIQTCVLKWTHVSPVSHHVFPIHKREALSLVLMDSLYALFLQSVVRENLQEFGLCHPEIEVYPAISNACLYSGTRRDLQLRQRTQQWQTERWKIERRRARQNNASIVEFPTEILIIIRDHLGFNETASMARVSHRYKEIFQPRLQQLCSSPQIWYSNFTC